MLKIESSEDQEYMKLKGLIKKNLGFNSEQYKDSHFKRRIDVRMRATGSKNFGEYVQYLNAHKDEYQQLMDTLTVNVTNFFRNSETYEVVEKEVLPAIIKSKSTGLRNIRIWSAGCSIGVEAYSIAILLHKILGNNFSRYNIQITGTDIDKDIIKRAEDAMYSEVEMKEVPADIRTKYFDYDGDSYHLKAEIKKVAKFRRNDLISGEKLTGFDAIFCRNVTIYFEKHLQETLYMDFYNGLNKGGFFVMGKTETLIGPSKDLFKAFSPRERIYQK